ncbi:MAG: putative capsid protein [Circoviridae sp.]|nr:MAG: putative capsid protein [Circoviridae sp.]
MTGFTPQKGIPLDTIYAGLHGLAAGTLKAGAERIVDNTFDYGAAMYKDMSAAQQANSSNTVKVEPARARSIQIEPNKSGTSELKRKKVHSGTQPKSSKKTMRDTQCFSRPMIGMDLIPSLSTNKLTGIVLNKQNSLSDYDPIGNFLSNLMQNGQTVCQWSGIITSESDFQKDRSAGARTTICQNFRHRFSSDKTIDFSNYSASNDGYPLGNGTVLYPKVNQYNFPAGTAVALNGGIYKHTANENCWAPLNRPDLEDMMWNLNKLKLSADVGFNQQTSAAIFQDNVPRIEVDAHRRQSIIEINNLKASKVDTTIYQATTPANYRFEAVLKGGHVKYNFMNKESTGARVEVIVYRMKKHARSNSGAASFVPVDPTTIDYGDIGANANPLSNIVPAVTQGYRDRYVGKLGTDDMFGQAGDFGGTLFNKDAVYTNPEYPLLPSMKETKQTNLAYKEVSRTAFALPAGGSRDLTVKFDGVKYDPADIFKFLNRDAAGGQTPYQLPGVLDDMSYAVVISVCGVKMTRLVSDIDSSGAPVSEPLFDVHSNAKVQYTAEYIENLGAACYKKPGKVDLYNNCLQRDTEIFGSASTQITPVTTIPVDKTVRLTQTSNTTEQSTAYAK